MAPRTLAGVQTAPPPLVVTNVADSGVGSLRQALLDANAATGVDNITFNIPGGGVHRIQPLSALPYIDETVTIDGSTQPGYSGTPLIEVSGTNVQDDSGLVIRANNCKVRALVVNAFGHDGITLLGEGSFNNSIESCYIGTDASGTVAQGNGAAEGLQYGVRITDSAGSNNIQDSLISGNLDGGITIEVNSANNTITGNRIGTDLSGATRVPNNGQGILVQGKSLFTYIQNNLISGNDGDGVHLFNAYASYLFGNVIGTNLDCNQTLENRGVGVYLTDDQDFTSDNQIGSQFTGEGNLISGNFRDGIRIEGTGVRSTIIQGNRIGTDGLGTSIIANGDAGVAIINSAGHQIGGVLIANRLLTPLKAKSTRPAPGKIRKSATSSEVELGGKNLLSGNGDDGLFIFGPDSHGNLVQENLIGTTITGLAPLANNGTGVTINGATDNTVSFNTISGNAVAGVRLEQGAGGNDIEENLIGTDPEGTVQVGGAGPGVLIETNALANRIRKNVISGNGGDGVLIRNGANANSVRRNRIGVDALASSAIPNNQSGIRIESPDNEIGATDGEGNVIGGNRLDGITISQNTATGNTVEGNLIGINNDLEIPNERHGISITAGAANNQIVNDNEIAANLQTGVSVTGGTGNSIRRNRIYKNGRLGIDLNEDAVTFNDAGDLDVGPNGLQNYPVITDVSSDETTFSISGYLDSEPNTTYLLDFYSNSGVYASGHGEGEIYLSSDFVTTDASGHVEFTTGQDWPLESGVGISATATAPDGSTSEFSENLGFGLDLTPPAIIDCTVTPRALPGSGGTVTIGAQVVDNSAVENVRALVTGPGGESQQVLLERQPDSDAFVGTFNAPANTGSVAQQYQVKLEAFDDSGNRSAADCGAFTVAVADNTPPTISNCTVTPRTLPSIGGYVTLRADVTDASGVMKVQAVVTNPDTTETVVPMNRQETSNTYEFNYMIRGNSGTADLTYSVRFEATDNAGNTATSPCGNITVTPPDQTGPAFANCEVIPRALPASGGQVQIRADVTDPSGVSFVEASVTRQGGSEVLITLARVGNTTTYQGTFNAPANASVSAIIYSVKLRASDLGENISNTDCGTFQVTGADTNPPVITNCQVTPTTLPPAGGTVTISADVTDDFGLRSVQGRVSRPDGTVAMVTLNPGANSHFTGTFQAPANTGTSDQTYTVFVVAVDGGNNTSIVRCGTFVVQAADTQAPAFLGCGVQPRRLPSLGGVFTITATVTDNRSVTSVVAKVAGPSGTTNVPLNPSGDGYTGTFTAPENLTAQDVNYQVTITATDPSNNQVTADCGTITVLKPDAELPAIVRCDVIPRTLLAPGGTVTLRADVTDNAGVDQVEAIIEIPDVFLTTVTLSLKNGNTYEGTWTAPANDTASPRSYHVTYRAVDTSDNEATADCGSVTVATPDSQAPVISACQVAPRSLLARGGVVTITATVTDDVAVSTVRAIITRPDGTQVPVNLTSQGGSNYLGNYAVPANSGATPQNYQVVINAQDSSGNPATADCGTVTVAVPDPAAPVITNCVVTPTALAAGGGTVTVTADVTDNVSVQSVAAEVQRPDGSKFSAQLSAAGGSGYTGTFQLPANDTAGVLTYAVRLIATDPSGNEAAQDCGTVTVAASDREAPTFANCSLSPNTLPFSGGAVQIQASVTDNVGVATVVARILRNGSLLETVNLTAGTGPNYTGAVTALANRTRAAQEYTVELVATDAAGNSRTVPCGTYTVQTDTVPPAVLACDATPRALPAEGGLVTFTATVTDAIPLDHVVAVVTRPDGSTRRVVLDAIGQDQFRGTWTVPANTDPTAQSYTVTVEAGDVAGNVATADCGVLTVALEAGGTAQISANQISFGRVRFGTRVRRQFVIRNMSHGSRLAVSLSTLSVPFRVFLEGTGLNGAAAAAGAKNGKSPAAAAPGTASSFSIGAGGIVTVTVEFAPPGIRNYSDRLLISTSDPRHREFRLRVTGVGCKNGRRGTPIGNGGQDSAEVRPAATAHKKR